MVPGVRLGVDREGNQVLESSRSSPGSGCTVVFLDRMQLHPPMPGQLASYLNLLARPEDVQGIEVYQASQVPGEFMSAGDRCMTIVIWTRTSVGEQPSGQAKPSP
jgi:hypothetical protein